jgi:ABC-type multidrug transport system fused ATPase/permease subunit
MFVKAARLLHKKLLNSILRTNIRFFDSTPLGRIVNRFSKDIEAVEESIPMSMKSLVICFLSLLSTVIVISVSTPLFLAAFVPILIVYILVQVNLLTVIFSGEIVLFLSLLFF